MAIVQASRARRDLLLKHNAQHVLDVARLALARDPRQAVRRVAQVLGRQHGVGLESIVLGPRLEHKLFEVAAALDEQLPLPLRHAQQVLQVGGHLRHSLEGRDQRVDDGLDAAHVGRVGLPALLAGDGQRDGGGKGRAVRVQSLAEVGEQGLECRFVDCIALVDDHQVGVRSGCQVKRLLVEVDEWTGGSLLDGCQDNHQIRLLRLLSRSSDPLFFDGSKHSPRLGNRLARPKACCHIFNLPRDAFEKFTLRLVKVLVLGEVDEGLELAAREQKLLPPALVRATQGARGAADGGAPLLLRVGGERVAEGLDLREVEPVVEEGPLGELARLGVPDPRPLLLRVAAAGGGGATSGNGSEDGFDGGGPTVDVQLEHILAGDGLGRGKIQDQGLRVEYADGFMRCRWLRIKEVARADATHAAVALEARQPELLALGQEGLFGRIHVAAFADTEAHIHPRARALGRDDPVHVRVGVQRAVNELGLFLGHGLLPADAVGVGRQQLLEDLAGDVDAREKGLRQQALLDDDDGDARGAQVLLGAKEDDGKVAHGDLAGEDVGRHVGDDNGPGAVGLGLEALGEGGELDAVDRLVVAVVDHGGVVGQLPRRLVGDGAELAVVFLARVGDDVDVLGAKEPGALGGGLLGPAAGDDVVELQLLLDLGLEVLDEGGLVEVVGVGVLDVGKDLVALALDPGADEVVGRGGELAAAAALHEEHIVVLGDVQVRGEVLLGLVDDLGGERGAVRVLRDAQTGALEVEQRLRRLLEDVGRQQGRAGAKLPVARPSSNGGLDAGGRSYVTWGLVARRHGIITKLQ
ncbi:bZIP transcription factor domain-containing protein [Purpureocillium lavendulum]|uniref:BZIP transcription factor domain-containing protein n=1 Tax=Purpureocillium lavendulum TaxID=1247861 RepID=A0AB34FGT7_9HYPO|nr:bZIP transcription factor domain-containing protein [Purpureocillium lavendulum]